MVPGRFIALILYTARQSFYFIYLSIQNTIYLMKNIAKKYKQFCDILKMRALF